MIALVYFELFETNINSEGGIILNTPLDIQLALMSTAYFYGDFSIIHHLTNRNTFIHRAIESADMPALSKFAKKHIVDLSSLSDEQKKQYHEFEESIGRKYRSELMAQALPLPEKYLEELGERALEIGNYSTAHSAFAVNNKMEKRVNEFIVRGVELLQSKDVRSSSSDDDKSGGTIQEKVGQSVTSFYQAIKLKNPLGNQFQYLSAQLHAESIRKYFKFVELGLLKEIIEFDIEYLVDDKAIANRIVENLDNAKVRKLFLKNLSQNFSMGSDNFRNFVDRYQAAVTLLKEAQNDEDLSKLQKVLLGRRTGDNQYYQYLKELAIEHPISSLLTAISTNSEGTPYLAPIVMKSGESLLKFLELDK